MADLRTNVAVRGSVVVASALTRKFGDLVAVDRVSLAINQSEIFGLIGPNGAGKSTLIRMLTTLLPPTSGSATIAGYDVVRHPAHVRQHIGIRARPHILRFRRQYGGAPVRQLASVCAISVRVASPTLKRSRV
jgi:ABC-type glutathione transport system ATPase component